MNAYEYTVETNRTCVQCGNPNMYRKPVSGPVSRNTTNYKCFECGQRLLIPPHGNAGEEQ